VALTRAKKLLMIFTLADPEEKKYPSPFLEELAQSGTLAVAGSRQPTPDQP
jgi:hypothetical protein